MLCHSSLKNKQTKNKHVSSIKTVWLEINIGVSFSPPPNLPDPLCVFFFHRTQKESPTTCTPFIPGQLFCPQSFLLPHSVEQESKFEANFNSLPEAQIVDFLCVFQVTLCNNLPRKRIGCSLYRLRRQKGLPYLRNSKI